jgi:predicted RNase H-like nuclease
VLLAVGADGCRGGWVRAARALDGGAPRVDWVRDVRSLLSGLDAVAALAIDIPIGLGEVGARACDVLARRALGRPRASSVFPTPIRAALRATTRAEASRITRERDGRGVGAQAFALWPRIREVDALLAREPLRERVCEVHPELSFQAQNGGVPLAYSKHDALGRAQRASLLDARLGTGCTSAARAAIPRAAAADDDVLDALACLWSALRIARGEAQALPDPAPRDRHGLPMCIRF